MRASLRGGLDQVVARALLLEHVWGLDFVGSSNVVDVVVSRIRRKIDGGEEQALLETVRGAGYRLRR